MIRDATTRIITQVIRREYIKQSALFVFFFFFTVTSFEANKQNLEVSNLVFYAQSTSTVTSGRENLESDITSCSNMTSPPFKAVTSPQSSFEKMPESDVCTST